MKKLLAALMLSASAILPATAGGDPVNWVFWQDVHNWRVEGRSGFGCRAGTIYDPSETALVLSINVEGVRLWLHNSAWTTDLPTKDAPVAVEIWSDGAKWPAGVGYVYEPGGIVVSLDKSGLDSFMRADGMAFAIDGRRAGNYSLTASSSATKELINCALAMLGKADEMM